MGCAEGDGAVLIAEDDFYAVWEITALLRHEGPIAVAWNDDLNSESAGQGLRVQAFTDPDRVVFDWDTETHSGGGGGDLSQFQIVFHATSRIVFHYIAFDPDTTCEDVGSGLTLGDGLEAIDLSAALDTEACTLAGRSFEFRPR